MPHVENYNGRNRRRGADIEFPRRRNRPNHYVNCAVDGQEDGNQYNRDYNDGGPGNLDYYWDRSEVQALLTGNGDNISPIELETEAIGGRHSDSDVAAYLANRSVSGEYRDVELTVE